MTQTLILLCTLAALAGLALGYLAGFIHSEADRMAEAYILGMGAYFEEMGYCPEGWR